MTRSPGLSALVSDGAILAQEAQLQLTDLVGESAHWDVDLALGVLRFSADNPVELPVQLLGSTAPGPRSWLWGWANPAGYPAELVSAGAAARELGSRYAIPELADAEVPFPEELLPGFGALFGQPEEEPGYRLGWDLSIASRVASGTWFGYSGPAGGGARVWMLLEGLVLAPSDLARTLQVVDAAFRTTDIDDQRRALSSYATLRAAAWDGAALTLPDGRIEVGFDEHGLVRRLTAISRTGETTVREL